MRTRVAATIASYPARFAYLGRVVERIRPQVDTVFVYLNNTTRVPTFLRRPDVVTTLGDNAAGDLRDGGKFYPIDRLADYEICLTLDDDIIYPPGYAKAMCVHLDRFDRDSAVGVHGVLVREPFVSVQKSRRSFHFTAELGAYVPVNLLGTGTMAVVTAHLSDLGHAQLQPGAVDVSFAGFANRVGMPLIAVPRGEGWLSPMELTGKAARSLYDETIGPESTQNREFGKQGPWGRRPIACALETHPNVAGKLGLPASAIAVGGIRTQGCDLKLVPDVGDVLDALILDRISAARSATAARPWMRLASMFLNPALSFDWSRTVELPGWGDNEIQDLISPLIPADEIAREVEVLVHLVSMRPGLGKGIFRRTLLRASGLDSALLERWVLAAVPSYSTDPTVHDMEIAHALAGRGMRLALLAWLQGHRPDAPCAEWCLLSAFADVAQADTWINRAFIASGVDPLGFPATGEWRLLKGRRSSEKPSWSAHNTPRISVGVVVRNCVETIIPAIESLLHQTYPNLEIVVVDNDSTDGTKAHLAAYETLDRIRLVRLGRNVGPYVGRNICIEQSTGEFVGFHDGDDFAHPTKFADQVDALLANPSAVAVLSTHVRVGRQGSVEMENHGQMLGHGPVTALFRISVFPTIGVYDATMTRGDIEFLERISAVFGHSAVVRLDKLHLLAGASDQSNSTRWSQEDLVAYRRAFREWHARVSKTGNALAKPNFVPEALRAIESGRDLLGAGLSRQSGSGENAGLMAGSDSARTLSGALTRDRET
jgi:hypothetical protein